MKAAKDQIDRAKKILAGKVVPADEIYQLAELLREEGVYSYARKLFGQLRKSQTAEAELAELCPVWDIRIRLALRHSACTYEDPDLRVDSRFDAALAILEEIEPLQDSKNVDVLALAGDIYVRQWETYNQKSYLERAHCYYNQAYLARSDDSIAAKKSTGYAGINAAFLLDRLAQLELEQVEEVSSTVESTVTVSGRRAEAQGIRRELIELFTPLVNNASHTSSVEWRLLTILAEAHFGLGEYAETAPYLTRALELPDIPDRKYEATTRRFIALYRLNHPSASLDDFQASEANDVLEKFLARRINTAEVAIESLFSGKVGLALSGNGFRAAFFHVGVLAKLAELGILRRIEVISCSSGGSIIGTQYYLELRKLLQSKADDEIEDRDYVEVVKRIEKRLLAGVQRDIEARSKINIWFNFKTAVRRKCTRTERIGELLYKEILCNETDDTDGEQTRYLSDLFVRPFDEPRSFKPKKDNWRRKSKVPILILNATTLNTGHNWQFTASWMGEPAGPISSEMDGNLRLKQVRFEDAPEEHSNFPIGRAVAASAAVPGLLEPIAIDGLYPDVNVRLIDGSVSEPLATTSIIEQGCTFLVVSDASGSTDTQLCPTVDPYAVINRSERISTSRSREAHYNSLAARSESSLLQQFMFIHLKKDLDSGTRAPFYDEDLSSDPVVEGSSSPLTSYGIRREVQDLLAKVRPELDTFSDTEAYALMTSGYVITGAEFQKTMGISRQQVDRPDWSFIAIEEQMKMVGDSDLLRLLAVAHNRLVRIWKLSAALQSFATFIVIAAVAGAIYLYQNWNEDFTTSFFSSLLWALFALFAAFVLIVLLSPLLGIVVAILKWKQQERSAAQILRNLGIFVFGWLGAWVQLLLFDRWYLSFGNIKDRKPIEETPPSRWAQAKQAVGDRLDPQYKIAADSINKAIDRFDTVEAVSKLFEAGGYEVVRFPRDLEINPFQLNLDLFASKGEHKLFADVKSGPDRIDWKHASGLKLAASVLKTQAGAESDDAVGAMLILIDVPEDQTLERFSEQEGVKVVRMDGAGIKRILENKGNAVKLQHEAETLNLFEQSVASTTVTARGGDHGLAV